MLSLQDIRHSYGGQCVLGGVSLTLHDGDRMGLIGRNGSGKSTLMKIMAARIAPDAGLVTRENGLRIAMLSQECALPPESTIAEVLEEATAEWHGLIAAYRAAMDRMASTPGDCIAHEEARVECDALGRALDAADAWDLPHAIKRVSVALDLPDEDRLAGTLSGGELRRLDLAAKLLARPDLLLLDEPTNHIDTRSVEWIERFIAQYAGACVLVTHDRYFLDRIVNRIVELEFNRLYSFPGRYRDFLERKALVEETQAHAEANRLAFLRRELVWFKRGPKARTGKEKARKDRIIAALETEPLKKHKEFVFEIPEPERLGKTILEAREITYGYGDATLFQKFSLLVQPKMRIGVIGPNGAGKTTLLRVLMGLEEPRKGKVITGDATHFLYVDQAHEDMDPARTVISFVSDGARHIEVNKKRIYVPAYLEHFLFDKHCADMPIANLSGGERNRLDMLKKLMRGGNFLVFDEPTNDLDLYTLRVLEETIERFDGCALVVSHDRYFLNRICTHILVFEPDARIVQIAGNYDDYLLYKERQARDAAKDAPPSVKTAQVPGKTSARRLTWKEKHELENIEAEILEAEAEAERLEAAIHAPGFYEGDHAAVSETLEALEAAKARVEERYARWQELEGIASGHRE